jgi:hypothetical protein
MQVIYEILYAHPVVALAQLAFMIWMLVDASRRRTEQFWIWVILFVPGLGAWAYFFAVKFADFRGLGLPVFQRRAALSELRYRAEQVPTLTNHLALAERLIELKDYAAAVPHLEAAHKLEPEHGQVLYLLSMCHVRENRPAEAIPLLDRVIRRDPRWSGYAAWVLLAEAHTLNGNKEEAVARCRDLVKLSPSLEHKCRLAEHLLANDGGPEARQLLEGALQDHHFAAGPIRRRNRRWASEARQLLKRT